MRAETNTTHPQPLSCPNAGMWCRFAIRGSSRSYQNFCSKVRKSFMYSIGQRKRLLVLLLQNLWKGWALGQQWWMNATGQTTQIILALNSTHCLSYPYGQASSHLFMHIAYYSNLKRDDELKIKYVPETSQHIMSLSAYLHTDDVSKCCTTAKPTQQ